MLNHFHLYLRLTLAWQCKQIPFPTRLMGECTDRTWYLRGAWAPEAVYTHNDIKGIVQYAKERGIRVVPEFDIPGHSYRYLPSLPALYHVISCWPSYVVSWGVGYPELVAKCPSWASDVNFWALNPVANSTFDFFYAFLTEMTTLFIDDYIHTVYCLLLALISWCSRGEANIRPLLVFQ